MQRILLSSLGTDAAIAASVPDPISLYDRLMAVKPVGLSKNAWRERAGLSRALWSDIAKNNAAKHSTIEKLLEAIGVTFAEFEAGVRQLAKDAPPPEVRAPFLAFRGEDRPRDIPIVGTAACADMEVADDGKTLLIETMELDFGNAIDHARRPASLDNKRDVYAIYYVGHSMSPRYEPGELSYVDPTRPPRAGEYVVAQLVGPDGEDGEKVVVAMAKKLVRQSPSFYEFEQFNPPLQFRVPRAMVRHLHRIIPWDELVAF